MYSAQALPHCPVHGRCDARVLNAGPQSHDEAVEAQVRDHDYVASPQHLAPIRHAATGDIRQGVSRQRQGLRRGRDRGSRLIDSWQTVLYTVRQKR